MFRRAAEAIAKYIDIGNRYLCPLCMYGYSMDALETGELTIEHVPPKSLGGRELLLTCRTCNSSSGHTLDIALYQREEQRRFSETVRGVESTYRGPAKWTVDNTTLNVEVYRDGKFVTIAGIPNRNNPAVTEKMARIRNLSGRLTSSVRFHRRRANIGDLRMAYLSRFYALGIPLHLSYRIRRNSVPNSQPGVQRSKRLVGPTGR